jgi:hypothetical protein
MRDVGILAAVVVLTLSTSAKAEPADVHNDFDSSKATTVRVQVPLAGLILWTPNDGGLSVFGLSASKRFAGIAEVEAGFSWTVNPCISGVQATFRAGISPSILRARPAGTHWNLRLPMLLGYHYLTVSGGGCDQNPDQKVHVAMVTTGLDATHWSVSGWGFNLRLLVGMGRGWSQQAGRLGVSESGTAVELGLTVGMSFQ